MQVVLKVVYDNYTKKMDVQMAGHVGMVDLVVMKLVLDVLKEKLASGKNLNHFNNSSVVIYFHEKKDLDQNVELKIVIKIFFPVRLFYI